MSSPLHSRFKGCPRGRTGVPDLRPNCLGPWTESSLEGAGPCVQLEGAIPRARVLSTCRAGRSRPSPSIVACTASMKNVLDLRRPCCQEPSVEKGVPRYRVAYAYALITIDRVDACWQCDQESDSLPEVWVGTPYSVVMLHRPMGTENPRTGHFDRRNC
jgi:hypothetical protein